jgi:hypothetical protein
MNAPETSPSKARHDAVLKPILLLIVEHNDEGEQWAIMESLCLGLGLLNNRTARGTATFVESIAERIATGARAPLPEGK